MVVYRITNTINGKIYVGQTTQPLERYLKYHVHRARSQRDGNRYFHNALRKYGVDAFKIEQIYLAKSKHELDMMERFFIILHQSHVKTEGYNSTLGGEGTLGSRRSKEAKEAISKANTGRLVSDETRRKMSQSHKAFYANNPSALVTLRTRLRNRPPMLGKHHSKESNQRNRDAHWGKIVSPETKALIGSKHKGRKRPLETGKRISAAKLGKRVPKLSKVLKGKPKSAQARLNMSLAAKRRAQRPECLAILIDNGKKAALQRKSRGSNAN